MSVQFAVESVSSLRGIHKDFAEQSEHLYYVGSIDDLAALFTATDAHAQAVKARITDAVNDENSALRAQLTEALKEHIADADWDTEELYSANYRFEAGKDSAELTSYSVDDDLLDLWKVDGEPGAWVVELTATVQADVVVDVQFFVWDSIDREELSFGGEQCTFSAQVEVEAYLTCYEIKLDAAPETWHIEVEIGSGQYGVVSRNRRKFRHPHAGPATSASRSRSITLASLWNV